MALDITRLSGGNTPADGSDPRTFPAIWNATSDALEADVIPTEVTSPATGQLLQYDGTNWVNVGQADAGAIPVFADAAARTTAIPSPSEGMVTYREDDDLVEVYNGASFVPVGGILQVVSTTKTDTFTTTSASFTTVTGLTATITPSSASSKILVLVQVSASLKDDEAFGHFKLSGGNTSGYVGDVSGSRVSGVFGGFSNTTLQTALLSFSLQFLDSPATTGAVTYGVETRNGATPGQTVFVNRGEPDGDTANNSRGASTITLMEVAG